MEVMYECIEYLYWKYLGKGITASIAKEAFLGFMLSSLSD